MTIHGCKRKNCNGEGALRAGTLLTGQSKVFRLLPATFAWLHLPPQLNTSWPFSLAERDSPLVSGPLCPERHPTPTPKYTSSSHASSHMFHPQMPEFSLWMLFKYKMKIPEGYRSQARASFMSFLFWSPSSLQGRCLVGSESSGKSIAFLFPPALRALAVLVLSSKPWRAVFKWIQTTGNAFWGKWTLRPSKPASKIPLVWGRHYASP